MDNMVGTTRLAYDQRDLTPARYWLLFADEPGIGLCRDQPRTVTGSLRRSVSELEKLIPAGDQIVVFAHARVCAKAATTGRTLNLRMCNTVGKALDMHAFADRREALR